MSEMKIVMWCAEAPNQKALANKIARRFHLSGIVVDNKKAYKKAALLKRLIPALQDRVFFRKINESWAALQHEYKRQFPQWPDVPLLEVESINSDEALHFTQNLSPDLIVVSGTALIKSKMLSLKPRIGIINLHTGLSPYIKGGPNCTNWCISTGQFDMIGNTIMWINEGIDAGNIITSECTSLSGVKDLEDIQWKVMEHAHELYLKAIDYLLNSPAPYNSVPQKEIGAGQLYLSKMWDFSAKRRLLRNLPAFINNTVIPTNTTITIPLSKNLSAV